MGTPPPKSAQALETRGDASEKESSPFSYPEVRGQLNYPFSPVPPVSDAAAAKEQNLKESPFIAEVSHHSNEVRLRSKPIRIDRFTYPSGREGFLVVGSVMPKQKPWREKFTDLVEAEKTQAEWETDRQRVGRGMRLRATNLSNEALLDAENASAVAKKMGFSCLLDAVLAGGNPMKPDATHHGFADQGGNRLGIDFEGVSSGSAEYPKNFHGFWDGDSVDEAMRLVKADIIRSHPGHSSVVRKSEYVDYFATTEPAAWKNGMNQDMDTWATTWANEIQPIAVEAHRRVEFVHVTTNPSKPEITGGVAKERPLDEHYLHWAGETVKLELGRAGWRLAALVKELFP